MARKNKLGGTETAEVGTYVEPVYQETFIAKTNHEGKQTEVILRGEESVHSIVLRKNGGKFKDGGRYTLTFIDQDELDGLTAEDEVVDEGNTDVGETANTQE